MQLRKISGNNHTHWRCTDDGKFTEAYCNELKEWIKVRVTTIDFLGCSTLIAKNVKFK